MASQLGADFRPTLNQAVITRVECYARYNSLVDREEGLSEKGETLDNADSQELSALSDLILRDKTEILCEEKIELGEGRSYYVLFRNNKVAEMTETIRKYLEINTVTKMTKAFETVDWYRKSILEQISMDHVSTMQALRNAHRCNMESLQEIKKLESLEIDVMTADVYPAFKEIFLRVFDLYKRQQMLNNDYNAEILRVIDLYRKVFDNPQEFVSQITKVESEVADNLVELGENFAKECASIKQLVERTFRKTTQELTKLVQFSPYHVFIEGVLLAGEKCRRYTKKGYVILDEGGTLSETNDPKAYNAVWRYVENHLRKEKNPAEIEADCSQPAIWKIERVDGKMLDDASYVLASTSHAVQQLKLSWGAKFSFFSEKKCRFSHCSFGEDGFSKADFLEEILKKMALLHASCIQNTIHNRRIETFYNEERDLYDRPIYRIGKGEKVYIQNSLSKKYLMCRAEEIQNASGKRSKDSEIFQVSSEKVNERAMWHLATCEEGLIIRNMVSKHYLIRSLEASKIMGNPLTHIRNQSKQENKKSILENTQVYEGVWKFIKLGDFIRKVESEIPRQFSPNRAAPFASQSLD